MASRRRRHADRPAWFLVSGISSSYELFYRDDLAALFVYNGASWVNADSLAQLNDVALTSPSNGQVLTFDSTSGKWKNQTASSGVTSISGGTGIACTPNPITGTGTVALASASDSTVKSNISGGSAAPVDNTLSAILDHILGNTQGSLIERGASSWRLIAPGSANTILKSGGSSADPSWATLTAIIDAAIGSTRGAVYRGSTGWAVLTPGTSRYVLTSGGVGANPSWALAGGGGGGGGVTSLNGETGALAIESTGGSIAVTEPDSSHVNVEVLGFSSAALAAAILADTPKVFYKFNESSGTTLTDYSGNSHNGTYNSSGVALAMYGAFVDKTCALFDGINGNATLPKRRWPCGQRVEHGDRSQDHALGYQLPVPRRRWAYHDVRQWRHDLLEQ